jgi:hypothetical protein
MFYVGEMPWHGLGVRLPARATYEEIVAAEKDERHVLAAPAASVPLVASLFCGAAGWLRGGSPGVTCET